MYRSSKRDIDVLDSCKSHEITLDEETSTEIKSHGRQITVHRNLVDRNLNMRINRNPCICHKCGEADHNKTTCTKKGQIEKFDLQNISKKKKQLRADKRNLLLSSCF